MEVQAVVLRVLPKAQARWDGHTLVWMDALWCDSQPGSSCPGSPRRNGWCCESCCEQEGPGKSRAAVAESQTRLVCQGASSTNQAGSSCSEQLKNWQVAVGVSGKVVN